MATNLPYPSIVFVPLDVLTAEELNQIVQNIEYLSSLFPIATEDLTNNSVTAQKIDFGTFANNNNSIRKVYTQTIAGTTDSNGFIIVPTSIVTPATGTVFFAEQVGSNGGLYFIFSGGGNDWRIRITGVDFANNVGNKSVQVKIWYFLN